jgi:hypothetical protein
MNCPANDHPMSMIMEFDKFEFLYQNPLDKDDDGNDFKDDDDDNNLKDRKLIEGGGEGIARRDREKKKEYETMTAQRGQAIAVTNNLPHGSGENNTKKEVYHWFA